MGGTINAMIVAAMLGAVAPRTPGQTGDPQRAAPTAIRVATFNVEDVRTEDLLRDDQPRLKRLAEVLQRIRPNIVLLNEIAYDMPGAPCAPEGEEPGLNAQRFAQRYLAIAQAPDVEPLAMRAFMAPSNTGMPSGLDLNNDGRIVKDFPLPPPGTPDGRPGPQTQGGRDYGGDCWGFGTFPGQYAMALLVDERLTIDLERVRTFQRLPWDYVHGAFLPEDPTTVTPWYSDEERALARLSSKSHWDVPVMLPNGARLHVLCSHPTPPAFDGPEQANHKRNHDEIRFWIDYLSGETYIVDDANRPGGIDRAEPFVILGDLNADPDEGDSFKDPIGRLLLASPRINASRTPTSDLHVDGLDPDDTAFFALRVDYVLPARSIEIAACGIWRQPPTTGDTREFPSDHFPVWADLAVPAPTVR